MALERVLEFSLIDYPRTAELAEDSWYDEAAVTLRTLCERYQSQNGGNLWFRILEDQKADLGHQAAAAVAIVLPRNAGIYHGVTDQHFFANEVSDRYWDPRASTQGETLRGRRDPSVLELMERAWKREQKRVEERRNDLGGDYLLSKLCEETLIRRFWAEDERALADYQGFFRASLPSGNVPLQVLTTVERGPWMDELVRKVFLGEEAPLSFTHKRWTQYDTRDQLVGSDSPFLVFPPFREALVAALRSERNEGILKFTKDGTRVWVTPDFRLDDPLTARNKAIEDWIRALEKK
jgi:hypothetical protein